MVSEIILKVVFGSNGEGAKVCWLEWIFICDSNVFLIFNRVSIFKSNPPPLQKFESMFFHLSLEKERFKNLHNSYDFYFRLSSSPILFQVESNQVIIWIESIIVLSFLSNQDFFLIYQYNILGF